MQAGKHRFLTTSLTASSCAGKTTLLDVLAGRKTQGEQSGRILFAGQKATQAFLKRFTGDHARFAAGG